MLDLIIIVLVVMWLLGIGIHIGGSMIHILLVVAVVILIFRVLGGRRAA